MYICILGAAFSPKRPFQNWGKWESNSSDDQRWQGPAQDMSVASQSVSSPWKKVLEMFLWG